MEPPTPTWYSMTIETFDGDAWRLAEPPLTFVREHPGTEGEIVAATVRDYDLSGAAAPWRIRLYAGYNRFEDLLLERSSTD